MFSYVVESSTRERIAALDFDAGSLPRENIEACDLCGVNRQQVISWIDRYGFPERFVLCEGCGLIFLNPRPTAEGYELFYEKYYRRLVTAWKGAPETAQTIVPGQRKYADYVVRFLKSGGLLQPNSRALDIGGSTGTVSAVLRDEGLRCLVLDPAPDELEIARGYGLETEQGLFETWDPLDRRFDLALVCQTVDHVLSVRQALEKIHRILLPGGLLFMDVTDFESAARCRNEYRRSLKIDHCFYLSDTTMRAYLATTGFEVVLSDITQRKLVYACRRTDQMREPLRMEAYAEAMSRMLRDRLVSRPKPYPIDALSRVWRRLRGNGSR